MAEDFQPSDEIVGQVIRWYKEARDHQSEWRDEARECYDFAAGKQWADEDLMDLQDQQRQAVTFNRILRTLNAVKGTQINNRQETRFLPREMGDVQVNEVLTASAEWVRDECDAEDEESDAFEDLLTCGVGWTETRVDYEDEPDGKILIDRIDPLEMYWDPSARKKNLVDRRWQMRVQRLDGDTFHQMWPEADVEAAAMPWDDVEEDDVTQRVHVYPQDAYKGDSNRSWAGRNSKITVAQVQWWDYEDIYRVGPQAEKLTADQWEKFKAKAVEQGFDPETIPVVAQKGKVYRQAFVAGNQNLEGNAEGPYPHGFTFHPMTGVRDRNRNVWLGLVHVMKDPQRWGNKFFSLILDIMAKSSKGGVLVEDDAVDDIRDLEQKWSSTDGVIKVRGGAIAGGKIQEKPAPKYPEGLDRLMGFTLDSVNDLTGVNMELLGFVNREQSGVLEFQRKQSGLTILATWFDALRKYRKSQGRTLLYMIQNYLPEGMLIRVVGDAGEQYVPLMKNPGVTRYDVIVDESPTSPNQKERVFGVMTELLPSLATMGITPPPEVLDYSPLPSSFVQKWKEHIEKGTQLPPEVQQQIEEGQKKIQQLAEENRKLKDKRQETQANLMIKAQESQAKRAEMELDLQRKRAEAEEEATLAREKAESEFALEKWKTEQQIELERFKAGAQFEVERMKADFQRQGQEETTRKTIESTPIKLPKRRISISRDENGFISGADLEDADLSADTETAGSA